MSGLPARAAGLLGARVAGAAPLAGGDLSAVWSVRFDDGREAVAKTGPAPQAEAGMLEAIAAAGAPAPAVLAADDDVLVLERLAGEGGIGGAEADLGAALRRLHAARGERYGWRDDYAFGPVAIPGGTSGDWPSFWAERRLLPQLPHVPGPLARRLERLAGRLPELLPAAPPPALLHGDMWAGNVVSQGPRVTGFVDPACAYGHAEVDLAMLHLFGRPGAVFREAYGAAEPGEVERRPVYQLWPALVHLRLFGAGYRGLVERLLEAAGG